MNQWIFCVALISVTGPVMAASSSCAAPNYLDHMGRCVAPPDASKQTEPARPAANPKATSLFELEKVWGAYAHIADRGGWWREARGAFWHYAWDGVGQHLLLRQYDKSGKEFGSAGFRIKDGAWLTDTGRRAPLPSARDRHHWGDIVLTPDLNGMSTAYEYGGQAYRYDWVRSSSAEFEAAVAAHKAAMPGKAPKAATVSTSTKAAGSPSLVYVTPKKVEVALQLGREFRITPEMVIQPRRDMFSQYYFFMGLRGRTGERYRISWHGPVSMDHEYNTRDAFDILYPSGQTIFDTTRSITITLKRDGEHALVFSQMGMQYPKGQSGGLAGPSLSGATPRAFQPILMTVSKL